MNNTLIYPIGTTKSCLYATSVLKDQGFPLTDHPTPEVTHLLLDVPSFRSDGMLRNGDDICTVLSMLPADTVIVGGNLPYPLTEEYRTMDLLQDPLYLARNAAITADCAIRIAGTYLRSTFSDSPTLILGWGRIGKCLANYLKALGCPVTIAARNTSDLAMIETLGYCPVDYHSLPDQLCQCRLLFNTVPALILDRDALCRCSNCTMIELASVNGLDHPDVITARGLPGTYAPESSGKLIASTFSRLWKERIA